MDKGMREIKNILFDLDGTLVASDIGITNGIKYACDKMNLELSSDVKTHMYIGPPIIHFAKDSLGLSEEDAVVFVRYFRSYYKEKGIEECALYPGIVDMLKLLCLAEKNVYICTSKPETSAIRMSKNLGIFEYMTGIIGANEERNEKIDVLRHLLNRYGIEAGEAVMIGDRSSDVIAGRNLGTRTIAVTFGYGSRLELENAEAQLIVDDVNELIKALL